MSIKYQIKQLVGWIATIKYRVKHREKHLYIGKACKIVNAENVYFKDKVEIAPYCLIASFPAKKNEGNIIFNESVEIGMFSRIACVKSVIFGKKVFTGPGVFISDFNHEYREIDIPINDQGVMIKKNGGISIGDETWIGTGVVIAGTVTIGKHCVIGANSVVTKDIPDYCVAAGNPCKIIKRYSFETKQWENGNRN